MVTDDFVTVNLDLPRKDKPRKTLIENIITYFREYCDATSIHGFRYFGESRTIFEKIWWLIVFSTCLILCVLTIILVYNKWDQSPVIVTFATKGKPICDIPFPAVTICSESKVKTSVFDYTNALIRKNKANNLTPKEEAYLGHLSFVCNYLDDFDYTSLNYTESDFFDVLKEVSPDFSIVNCKYAGRRFLCEDYFVPIATDDGLCYTFNMLDRTEVFNDNVVHYSNYHAFGRTSDNWSIENGYKEGADERSYPKRALLPGARYGLNFDIKISNEKTDTMCRNSVEGYRILFHSPTRLPRPSLLYIRVPLNRAFAASIRPSQMMTSKAIKNYSAEKRQCYFPFEKKLKYFRTYNEVNCDMECLTNFTLKYCGCVLFFMPRENSTRICNAIDFDCAEQAQYELQTLRLHNRIMLKQKEKPEYIKENICHCMPMCADIVYTVGSSQSTWNWSAELESGLYTIGDNDSTANYHLSRVRAYFVSGSFIGSERNELYGPTDFLANFGGLLGLFTGFSILSLMEIIYFLSVRLICNCRLYGYWSGQQ